MSGEALLVNLRTHHAQAGNTTVAPASLIGVDFWGQPQDTIREAGTDLILSYSEAALNMPAGCFPVADPLVRSVTVRQVPDKRVEIVISRYLAGPWHLEKDQGALTRYDIRFAPEPLQPYFADKIILLDAWDRQDMKSPTGLSEKTATRDVARRLARLLTGVGAKPFFARPGPNYPTHTVSGVFGGDVCNVALILATRSDPSGTQSGFTVGHKPDSNASRLFAGILIEELKAKIPLPLLSQGESSNRLLRRIPSPGAVVEIGSISHRIDEGLMRDIDHQQKTAQGLFNSLRRFFVGGVNHENDDIQPQLLGR